MPEQLAFDFDPSPGRLLVNENVERTIVKESLSSVLIPGDPPSDTLTEATWMAFLRELVDILREALAALHEARVLRTLRRYA